MAMPKRYADLTGKTFGRLTVLASAPSMRGRARWLVRCECGKEQAVLAQTLRGDGRACMQCSWAAKRGKPLKGRARRGELYAKRVTSGACGSCGAESPASFCAVCSAARRERSKRLRARHRETGLCLSCVQPSVAGVYCLIHWFRRVARNNSGAATTGEQLAEIWQKQSGKCAYTGEALVPGENASLDHRVPVGRGGSSSIENLQWVTWRINRSKSDMTHDEFVAMCRLVSERFS